MNKLIKITLLLFFLSYLVIIDIDVNHQVFGQKYSDYTVIIDPGHGGADGGARGESTLEKDVNLKISLYLKRYLTDLGINVLMIRETDIDFREGRHKQRSDLTHRINMINESHADLYISIHMNAMPDGRWRGAQTFYYPRDENNKLLANAIQDSLKDILKNTNRKAKANHNLYLFKYAQKSGVLVECGFLSNSEEEQLLKSSVYQEQVAYSIYLGIIDYLSQVK